MVYYIIVTVIYTSSIRSRLNCFAYTFHCWVTVSYTHLYGNESIDQSDSYWMESSLKISAFEQVSLLTDFYQNTFAFNPEHIAAVKDSIRLITHGKNTLYGKTGTGNVNGQNVNGWFIGYIENSQNTYLFATNIQAEQQASGSTASQITLDLLEDMGIWN